MMLIDAERLAEELTEAMRPYCGRIQVAGSIRRRRPDVGDIELVALPHWEEQLGRNLFSEPERVNLLHVWAAFNPACPVVWEKGLAPEGKYWRGRLGKTGPALDLFLPGPDNWGIILAIRTGSSQFSEALVTHAKRIGRPCSGGYLRDTEGRPIATPEEQDVFRLLGLAWVEPELRTGPEALRKQRVAR